MVYILSKLYKFYAKVRCLRLRLTSRYAMSCALVLILRIARHINFSYENAISGTRSLRPSEVVKAVCYDSALSGDSRSCGDTPVKCIDICHSRENRKKVSTTHNIDKPWRCVPITNTMHSPLKPDERIAFRCILLSRIPFVERDSEMVGEKHAEGHEGCAIVKNRIFPSDTQNEPLVITNRPVEVSLCANPSLCKC